LDLPLPELQGLKTLKIAYHNAKTEEVTSCQLVIYVVSSSAKCCVFLLLPFINELLDHLQVSAHNIRLPKQSTVGDVINELKTKVSSFASHFVWEYLQAVSVFLMLIPFYYIAF